MVQFRVLTPVLMMVLLVGLSACNGGRSISVDDNTSPQEILALAQGQVDRGKFDNAGDLFLEVERLYPYTIEAELAVIEAAKAYHDGASLIESRSAANRYLDYYPRGEYAALAQYLVALSYYDQIVDIQRDQQNTFRALQALRIVIEQFPGSQYAELAIPKFTTALNQLAGKEMDIGRYYLKRGQYSAAIGRFDAVVDEYGDNPHLPEAYHRLVEAYLSLGLNGEAARNAAILAERFPDNAWTIASQSLMATGRQSNSGVGLFGLIFQRN
ncbi:MAG: outer membrane protein assembly factor BamD [Rhodobacteraceae bacterium]|nr:outer membrane protein assembly factor BamD [Paracoccaceae bacterium]